MLLRNIYNQLLSTAKYNQHWSKGSYVYTQYQGLQSKYCSRSFSVNMLQSSKVCMTKGRPVSSHGSGAYICCNLSHHFINVPGFRCYSKSPDMIRNNVELTVKKSVAVADTVKCRRLEGRSAVVTASTDGIGFAIARRLAQEGAKVMISSRKEDNVKKAVKELQSEGLNVSGTICHVGKKEDRANLFKKVEEEFGVLDILVSNAAVNPTLSSVLDCPEEVWDKIFDVNVKSTYLLLRESLPLIRKSKHGSIIIISSIAAYSYFSVLGPYSVSKVALIGLCKTAANDLGSEGIRVNCIAPGIIKTKFSKPFYANDINEREVVQSIALQRLGVCEEIASVGAFLASDDSSYITGETIVPSGGMASRL